MEAKVTGLEEELADLRVEKESLEKVGTPSGLACPGPAKSSLPVGLAKQRALGIGFR